MEDLTSRLQLKEYFKANLIPTEEQFHALIDSQASMADDGLYTDAESALQIEVPIGSNETRNVLSIFESLKGSESPHWSLAVEPGKLSGEAPGLSFLDGAANSRLYLRQGGNEGLGIGATDPTGRLQIRGHIPLAQADYETVLGASAFSAVLGSSNPDDPGTLKLHAAGETLFGYLSHSEQAMRFDSNSGNYVFNADQGLGAYNLGKIQLQGLGQNQVNLLASEASASIQLQSEGGVDTYFTVGNAFASMALTGGQQTFNFTTNQSAWQFDKPVYLVDQLQSTTDSLQLSTNGNGLLYLSGTSGHLGIGTNSTQETLTVLSNQINANLSLANTSGKKLTIDVNNGDSTRFDTSQNTFRFTKPIITGRIESPADESLLLYSMLPIALHSGSTHLTLLPESNTAQLGTEDEEAGLKIFAGNRAALHIMGLGRQLETGIYEGIDEAAFAEYRTNAAGFYFNQTLGIAGKLGVGTRSPQKTLEVREELNATTLINSSGASPSHLQLQNPAGQWAISGPVGGHSSLWFGYQGEPAEGMALALHPDGRLSIGHTGADQQLSIKSHNYAEIGLSLHESELFSDITLSGPDNEVRFTQSGNRYRFDRPLYIEQNGFFELKVQSDDQSENYYAHLHTDTDRFLFNRTVGLFGNLGVGVDRPVYAVDVEAGQNPTIGLRSNDSTTPKLRLDRENYAWQFSGPQQEGEERLQVHFLEGNQFREPVLSMSRWGNVGMGIDDPQATLHLYTTGYTQLKLQNSLGEVGLHLSDEPGIAFKTEGDQFDHFSFDQQIKLLNHKRMDPYSLYGMTIGEQWGENQVQIGIYQPGGELGVFPERGNESLGMLIAEGAEFNLMRQGYETLFGVEGTSGHLYTVGNIQFGNPAYTRPSAGRYQVGQGPYQPGNTFEQGHYFQGLQFGDGRALASEFGMYYATEGANVFPGVFSNSLGGYIPTEGEFGLFNATGEALFGVQGSTGNLHVSGLASLRNGLEIGVHGDVDQYLIQNIGQINTDGLERQVANFETNTETFYFNKPLWVAGSLFGTGLEIGNESNQLYFEETQGRLGVGNRMPATRLHVGSNAALEGWMQEGIALSYRTDYLWMGVADKPEDGEGQATIAWGDNSYDSLQFKLVEIGNPAGQVILQLDTNGDDSRNSNLGRLQVKGLLETERGIQIGASNQFNTQIRLGYPDPNEPYGIYGILFNEDSFGPETRHEIGMFQPEEFLRGFNDTFDRALGMRVSDTSQLAVFNNRNEWLFGVHGNTGRVHVGGTLHLQNQLEIGSAVIGQQGGERPEQPEIDFNNAFVTYLQTGAEAYHFDKPVYVMGKSVSESDVLDIDNGPAQLFLNPDSGHLGIGNRNPGSLLHLGSGSADYIWNNTGMGVHTGSHYLWMGIADQHRIGGLPTIAWGHHEDDALEFRALGQANSPESEGQVVLRVSANGTNGNDSNLGRLQVHGLMETEKGIQIGASNQFNTQIKLGYPDPNEPYGIYGIQFQEDSFGPEPEAGAGFEFGMFQPEEYLRGFVDTFDRSLGMRIKERSQFALFDDNNRWLFGVRGGSGDLMASGNIWMGNPNQEQELNTPYDMRGIRFDQSQGFFGEPGENYANSLTIGSYLPNYIEQNYAATETASEQSIGIKLRENSEFGIFDHNGYPLLGVDTYFGNTSLKGNLDFPSLDEYYNLPGRENNQFYEGEMLGIRFGSYQGRFNPESGRQSIGTYLDSYVFPDRFFPGLGVQLIHESEFGIFSKSPDGFEGGLRKLMGVEGYSGNMFLQGKLQFGSPHLYEPFNGGIYPDSIGGQGNRRYIDGGIYGLQFGEENTAMVEFGVYLPNTGRPSFFPESNFMSLGAQLPDRSEFSIYNEQSEPLFGISARTGETKMRGSLTLGDDFTWLKVNRTEVRITDYIEDAFQFETSATAFNFTKPIYINGTRIGTQGASDGPLSAEAGLQLGGFYPWFSILPALVDYAGQPEESFQFDTSAPGFNFTKPLYVNGVPVGTGQVVQSSTPSYDSVSLGEPVGNMRLSIGEGGGGTYRTWMKEGIYISDKTDNFYLGMRSYASTDRSDPVIGWGDNPEDRLRFQFMTTGSSESLEVMQLTADGKLGIGLNGATASRPLHIRVKPGIQRDYAMRIDHADNTTEYWEIGVDREASDADLLLNHKGNLITWCEPASGIWTIASDRKLKKEVKPIKGVLNKLLELKPCTYKFKKDEKQKIRIGMIAQEVQEIFPELVSNKEHLGLDYTSFGVLAVAAIQEQQETITQLQEQVKQLMEAVGLSAKATKAKTTSKTTKKTD